MEVSIQATIDDLNQYLQGNVTAMGLIITLEDMIEFLKDSEGISENKEFDLKKYLTEGKLIKESLSDDLEKRNEIIYDDLVSASGKSDTVEGEMLRAINRIIYRYYNDGDKYFLGYGTETAGPAHSYLVNSTSPIKSQLDKIFSGIDLRFEDEVYERGIEKALELIVGYVEEKVKDDSLSPNTEDMFDYESEFEDEEEDDDYGYDNDYEDEDEDEYY